MNEPLNDIQEKIAEDLTTLGVIKGLEAVANLGFAKPSKDGSPDNKRLTQKIDEYLEKLDRDINAQLDAILHHEKFQALESAWRSLKTLVDRTDFQQIKLEFVQVTKDELREHLVWADSIDETIWYKWIYKRGLGQFGGDIVGTVIGNFFFDNTEQDIALLKKLAHVGAIAHAPFIGAVSPQFFGWNSWYKLPDYCKLLPIRLQDDQYTSWKSFRKEENARYVALTLPRVLLRSPYDPKQNQAGENFEQYKESHSSHDDYLWGNAAFALAGCMATSFARYGWLAEIIGPRGGGIVSDLPVHIYESAAGKKTKIPTEVLIPFHEENVLSEEGFIALTMREHSDEAVFFSDSTVLKPRKFEDKAIQANYMLSTKLTYMSLINRVSHYLKWEQIENLGKSLSAGDLQNLLLETVKQWVYDGVQADYKIKKPFKKIDVEVKDKEGHPGWYEVTVKATPHIKYLGADFTLTLTAPIGKD